MLLDEDIARLELEIVVKGAAPRIFREDLVLVTRLLIWGRVFPTFVLEWLPSAVGYEEDPQAGFSCGAHDCAQVVK
jgi:hypothetical protein